jgi:hypothetical protein
MFSVLLINLNYVFKNFKFIPYTDIRIQTEIRERERERAFRWNESHSRIGESERM